MKIEKISITRGKKVNLGNYETELFEITMEVQLDTSKDEPHDVINGIKKILDQKLIAWEQSIKNTKQNTHSTENELTSITTADKLINEPEIEPKNTSNETIKPLDSNKEPASSQFICPKCKEPMKKKEGKDYYLCSSHWGYPDMIKKGEVREKNF